MKRRRSNRLIIVMVIGVFLFALGLIGQLGPVRWLGGAPLAPITSLFARWGGAAHETIVGWSQVGQLGAQNKRLISENAELRARLADNAELARQNNILRQQLGLNLVATRRQVAAQILSYQPDSYRQFVTIGRGQKDGVSVGQAVTSSGVLIGTVSRVDDVTAEVRLVTDPSFKLVGRDQVSGATGVITGRLGNGLFMSEIGQTDIIKPADTIVTSGIGSVVPEGIIIGQIETVHSELHGIFQSADIATTLKPTDLAIVFVVVGP